MPTFRSDLPTFDLAPEHSLAQTDLFGGEETPRSSGGPSGRKGSPAPPIRAVALPRNFPRRLSSSPGGQAVIEQLVLSRAAYLGRAPSPPENAVREGMVYSPERSGRSTDKKSGRAAGAIRGIAEDIFRRIFKRAVPKVGDTAEEDFRALHDEVRSVVQQTEHLVVQGSVASGPASHLPNDSLGDYQGQRLPLSKELKSAAKGRLAPAPPPFVRCTGPDPSSPHSFWAHIEKIIARGKALHKSFVEAVSAERVDENRRPQGEQGFVTQDKIREGESASQISIGRWRRGEAGRPDRGDCAVRVPWIVAEVSSPPGIGWRWQGRYLRTLLSHLKGAEVDLSDVVVTWSGGGPIQVRIPDGVVGSPIYRNARAATNAIRHFFDDLCSRDEVVRDAIDERLFSPDRLVPTVGSVHPETGQRVVGTDGETFLEQSGKRSFGQPQPNRTGREPRYTRPGQYPLPRQAEFHWVPFLFLDPHRRDPDHKYAGGAYDGPEVGHLVRQLYSGYGSRPGAGTARSRTLNRLASGVVQGENWGTSIDSWYTGRKRAALFVSHDQLWANESPGKAWRAVKAWNAGNRPPLPESELKLLFEEAQEDLPGWAPTATNPAEPEAAVR